MRDRQRLQVVARFASVRLRGLTAVLRNYPKAILDLIIYHKFHFHMTPREAFQAFRRLKSAFVDWNEVRISSVKEIQEFFAGVPDSLELAIFIKDFLEHLHRDNQSMSLEFLAELPLGDIRRYLRGIRGLDAATIGLVLRLRKEYPVLPLTPSMERSLLRLGLVRRSDSRDRKERYLHGRVSGEQAILFHHFLLEHSREVCPLDEERVQCPSCCVRNSCNYFARLKRRAGGRRILTPRSRVPPPARSRRGEGGDGVHRFSERRKGTHGAVPARSARRSGASRLRAAGRRGSSGAGR